MRVVAPPDHLHGDGRGAAQRPEDDAVAPVLGRGAFRSDADAAACRDDREPVIDVAGFADARLTGARPQVQGGGSGPRVDQQRALRYLIEPDGAPARPWIVGRERAVAPFITNDGAGEAVARGGRAQDRDVAQTLGQAARCRVDPNQVQVDARVPGGPAVLELPGVPPHGRPGVTDAEGGVAGGRLGDQVVRGGENLPGLGEYVHARRRRRDAPAGAVQQPDAEDPLKRHEVA
jgi:hypothetical protein